MAAALRKCFAMRDPEVINCVANLGIVRHEDLNRLLRAAYLGHAAADCGDTLCISEGVKAPAEREGMVLICHARFPSIIMLAYKDLVYSSVVDI